jgi:hypothetical protein
VRNGQWVIRVSLKLSILMHLSVPPCFGQAAKMFVKVEPNQCWLDVKDSVHRRANGVMTDDKFHTLTIDRFASIDGTIAIVVEVQADQNKKGETGCSIVVAETGSSSPHGSSDRINAANGTNNFRAAAYIANDVKAAQKERDKKAKANSP